jgi:hypothetical protein
MVFTPLHVEMTKKKLSSPQTMPTTSLLSSLPPQDLHLSKRKVLPGIEPGLPEDTDV